jgi:hypothetical protein
MARDGDSEPVTRAMIAAGLSQLPPMDETFAHLVETVGLPGDAESGTGGGTLDMSEESKVALAISAGGDFGRAPDNRRPRGYLRWGCPWRSPKTLAVSGGVGRSFWRRVHLLRASPRRVSYPAPVPWSRNHRRRHGFRIGRAIPCHSCHSVPLRAIVPLASGTEGV